MRVTFQLLWTDCVCPIHYPMLFSYRIFHQQTNQPTATNVCHFQSKKRNNVSCYSFCLFFFCVPSIQSITKNYYHHHHCINSITVFEKKNLFLFCFFEFVICFLRLQIYWSIKPMLLIVLFFFVFFFTEIPDDRKDVWKIVDL